MAWIPSRVPSTPFNRCKLAMRKLDKGGVKSAVTACAGVSKVKIKGKPGTPFTSVLRVATNCSVTRPEETAVVRSDLDEALRVIMARC